MACECEGSKDMKFRRQNWRVIHRHHNHSIFHGGYQASDYSEILCLVCGNYWRTKAKYVDDLPDERFLPGGSD